MKVMEDGTRVPVREEGRPTVVVGVDGSPGSRAALVDAMRSASLRGARLHVVAVYELPEWRLGPTPGCPLPSRAEIETEMLAAVREMVTDVAYELGGEHLRRPEVDVVALPGDAAEVLVHAAEGADELSWATAAVVRWPARCSARSGWAACSTRPAPCGSCPPGVRHRRRATPDRRDVRPCPSPPRGTMLASTDVVAFTLVGPGPSPRTRRAAGGGACRDHGVPGG